MLRVLYYSIAGAVFTAVVAVLNASSPREFLSMLPLCLLALFICAFLSLIAMRYFKNTWSLMTFGAVWVLITTALPVWLGNRWETALSGFPILISVAATTIFAALFFYFAFKLLSEEKNYAIA